MKRWLRQRKTCSETARGFVDNGRDPPDCNSVPIDNETLRRMGNIEPMNSWDELPHQSRSDARITQRPMNTVIVWSRVERKRLASENPDLRKAEVSKILGKFWKLLPQSRKRKYVEEAEQLHLMHIQRHSRYRYKHRRRRSSVKKSCKLRASEMSSPPSEAWKVRIHNEALRPMKFVDNKETFVCFKMPSCFTEQFKQWQIEKFGHLVAEQLTSPSQMCSMGKSLPWPHRSTSQHDKQSLCMLSGFDAVAPGNSGFTLGLTAQRLSYVDSLHQTTIPSVQSADEAGEQLLEITPNVATDTSPSN